MASPLRQETRIGELETPFGSNVLALTRFNGTEGMNELFEFRIEAISKKEDLDFNAAIGKHCSLRMKAIGGGDRWFDGILAEAQWLGAGEAGCTYQLVLRPWLWVLSRRKKNMIFHNMTAPKIIAAIFDDGAYSGLAVHEPCTTKSYPELEYCVQYRESDLDFVCRLMEQHGIRYYFRHEKGKHTLVMGDSKTASKPIAGTTRPFYPVAGQHRRDEEHFFNWIPERRFTTGKVTLNDYDFKKPSAVLKLEKIGDAEYEHGKLESYDYPGKYVTEAAGSAYAQVRLDMERSADGRFLATGDCVSCYPGALVKLTKHTNKKQNEEYLALRCTHAYAGQDYRSGGPADSGDVYQGNYEFALANQPFAPPMVTEKPYVFGPQTAKVVGSGEIDCDKYGRIKVRFHWDHDDKYSMRCRLAQVWAGKNWGGIFIPRVGMEVIVEFLEGDPDQPIVTGCVYNDENMPPFPLADKKNIAGLKSNSTTGGGGYNEFVMDDSKGEEVVRVHAQKDLDSTVLNDERRAIGHDRTTSIGNDESLTVGRDRSWTIGRNETHEVGSNRDTTIGKDDTLTVGKEITITAGNQITLLCGASKIVMKKDGTITISSTTIELKAAGKLTAKSGALSKYEAGAVMQIQGAIVKIN